MNAEQEFVRQRLDFVQQRLACPRTDLMHADKGRVQRGARPGDHVYRTYRREARLLRKLLRARGEGQVMDTLQRWRGELGGTLTEHRRRHKIMQDAYDDWMELPWHRRVRAFKPPPPPPCCVRDAQGDMWTIDDRLLALLDDLIRRLEKWLAAA